ncbi:sulfatase-like hydrolase/transferase [Paraglaciecola sp. L3A3]|uniref:sulfatase-like hydrolase/transferase n=1 Tax=Paraglaciecola sp. L3A3 TaxID=2686358 RepID=UPI00131E3348|nr:sulfatase-like hydrolase/transferase [Paraglaciecola sp. L3A3]
MYKKLILVIAFYAVALFSGYASAAEKPNILFIFADDQMYKSLGTNNKDIKTPNLDSLAARGVSFTHAYNPGSYSPAVCMASRMMLNSGAFLWQAAKYPSRNKIAANSTNSNSAYWSQYIKDAGYETYMSGKWHVPVSAKALFDHSTHIRAGMPKQTPIRYRRKFIEGEADTWSPYDKSKGGFWQGGKHWSKVLADDGQNFLEQTKNSDKPFFMYLAFNAPHDPRQAPKKFVDMYPVKNITVPENFLTSYPYNEHAGAPETLRDERLAPHPRTKFAVQTNLQEYYASISHLDEQVGRILKALEATGKEENTYIIFTADHGLAVGDHGFMGKQNMYDRSIRVPLFIVGPGLAHGKQVTAPVYLQDVMPTSIELAGAKVPENVAFHSLLPLATGKTDSSAYPAIYGAYTHLQRMYRTEKYKLIIYPNANVVRLYDMANDPFEMHDLAEAKNKPVKLMGQLFSEFLELQKAIDDPLDVSQVLANFLNGVPALPLSKGNAKHE